MASRNIVLKKLKAIHVMISLRSRRLEVVGTRKNAREKETREGRGSACTDGPRKSFPAPSPITWQPLTEND